MTKITRTQNEITKAIYDACNGDWTDSNPRIAQLQNSLIAALIWEECAPVEGWHAVATRQIEALNAIKASHTTRPIDLMAPAPEVSPDMQIKMLAQRLADRNPWDIEGVDAYIARHSS